MFCKGFYVLLSPFRVGAILFYLTIHCGFLHAGSLTNLKDIQIDGNQLSILTDSGQNVKIDFLTDKLFRIQASENSTFTGEGSKDAKIVIQTQFESPEFSFFEHSDYSLVKTNSLALRVYSNPLRFELYQQDNQTLIWTELKPIYLNEKGSYQTLAKNEKSRFFGGGQQNGSVEFHNKNMEISYSGGWEEGDRPSPAPFYMTNNGYGVLRNTWSNGNYDFRSSDYLTTQHKENRLDGYYFVGKNINEILSAYTKLTGRAKLLPRWAFEYGDADCYNDQDNEKKPGTVPNNWKDGPTGTTPDVVTSVAAKYRAHDMPGGWLLPNDGYGCGYTDLPAVVEQLASFGFKTGLWTESGVDKIAWEVGKAGSRAQKLDVAWTGKGYQFSLDANKAAAEGITKNSEGRPFIWTVMGWAGTQRYAVTWTGDQSGSWDYIRWHIPTLIGSGLSGQAYATGDVDGIFGGSAETFTRDLQWKSLTPVFMGMSGWSKTSRKHPWWFEEPYRSINRDYLKLKMRLMPYIYTYAWQTEKTGAPIVRGLMWDYPQDQHAFDETYINQFFLGEHLLVAPVFKSQAASGGWRENIYLPKGNWIDYWDGRVVHAGSDGMTIDYAVTLDKLPLFVKGGAIIPLYPESLYDAQRPKDHLTLDLYPDGVSEFTLYEDDGITRQYQGGKYTLQTFRMTAPKIKRKAKTSDVVIEIGAVQGEFNGQFEKRNFDLKLHSRMKPNEVSLNGRTIKKLNNSREFEKNSKGWYFNSKENYGVTYVKLDKLNVRQNQQVVFSIDSRQKMVKTKGYPNKPKTDNRLSGDQIKVVSRPTEEDGYPLENAFDADPKTWFRSVRDYSQQTGPHELVLAFNDRLSINAIEVAPRTDQHWKYGQVRDYEIYIGDINGEWGDPVVKGSLESKQNKQIIKFKPIIGRLLRFRVLSTQDQGTDPMVLGVDAKTNTGSYNAFIPMKVNPLTLSEFNILLSPFSERAKQVAFLSRLISKKTQQLKKNISINKTDKGKNLSMNGLIFSNGLNAIGNATLDYELEGSWHLFRADIGIDDSCDETVKGHFQIYGDDRLLYDSGEIVKPVVVKPELDIRGLSRIKLVTKSIQGIPCFNWANAKIIGYEGDKISRNH